MQQELRNRILTAKSNYFVTYTYQVKKAENAYSFALKSKSDNNKLYNLQQALAQNPYKAKYHKQYAESLYSYFISIKHNKCFSDTIKKEIDIKAQMHYDIYKTINQVDKFFAKNSLSRKSILYFNTLQNYLNTYEYKNGLFHTKYGYSIHNNNLKKYRADKEYSTQPCVLFDSVPSKKANTTLRSSSCHGTGTKATKYGSFLLPFLFALFSQMFSVEDANAKEKQESVLVDNELVMDISKTTQNLQGLEDLEGLKTLTTTFGLDRKTNNTTFIAIALVLLMLAMYFARSSSIKNIGYFQNIRCLSKILLIGRLFLNSIALISGLSLISLTSLGQAPAEGGFLINRPSLAPNGMDSARIILTNLETNKKDTLYTNYGLIMFDNIDLEPLSVENKPQQKPLAEVIGSGRDHTFNFESTNKPSNLSIYNIIGQKITELNAEWDQKSIASAYWDGKTSNGSQVPNGIYIFSNGKEFSKKFLQFNEGESFGYRINSNFANKVEEKNNSLKNIKIVQKDFKIDITPKSTHWQHQFMDYTDTITLEEGYTTNNEILINVDRVSQTQDLTFKLVDHYSHTNLEGFILNLKDNADTSVTIASSLTDVNGEAHFQDIPANKTLYLEYGGDTTYYASKGNLWNLPETIIFQEDTVENLTIRLALPNKTLPIPATVNDPNYGLTISPTAFDITEMIRGPPSTTNMEETMGRKIRLHLDGNWTSTEKENFVNTLSQTDSLFYGDELSPFEIVSTAIDLNLNVSSYNHNNNFLEGQLGWNIRDGPGYTDAKVNNNYQTNNLNENNDEQVANTFGGEITTGPGAFPDQAKELYGRRTYMANVSYRMSFMNDFDNNGGTPTLIDRAIYKLDRTNEKNQYVYKIDFYDLKNIKDSL